MPATPVCRGKPGRGPGEAAVVPRRQRGAETRAAAPTPPPHQLCLQLRERREERTPVPPEAPGKGGAAPELRGSAVGRRCSPGTLRPRVCAPRKETRENQLLPKMYSHPRADTTLVTNVHSGGTGIQINKNQTNPSQCCKVQDSSHTTDMLTIHFSLKAEKTVNI